MTEASRAALEEAIDGLYAAFGGYTRPLTFHGCSCCWDGTDLPDGGGRLVRSPGGTGPLRSLRAAELAEVATQVPVVGGNTDVLKHYLPRLFEIAFVDGGFGWPDPEIVVGHIAYGQDSGEDVVAWTGWPEPERAAVRAFLRALWRDRLTAEVTSPAVDEALCAAGIVEPDIDWYLRTWLRFENPNAAGHLEQFLMRNAGCLVAGKLDNAYWQIGTPHAAANRRRIVAWTRAETTLRAVADAADRARTPAEREALEECYLRWLG